MVKFYVKEADTTFKYEVVKMVGCNNKVLKIKNIGKAIESWELHEVVYNTSYNKLPQNEKEAYKMLAGDHLCVYCKEPE
jgi:hypothetical protein